VQCACQRRYGRPMRIASTTKLDLWVLGGLLATAIVAGRGTPGVEVPTTRELHAAVLSNGFALMEGTPNDRHVISVDWDGGTAKRLAVPVIAPEARMVGTSAGIAIGWLENRKLHLARLKGDGELAEAREWGKRVKQLCEGTISNEHQFGIGWLENDGTVWVVHGPMKQRLEATEVPISDAATATRTVWCGVTGAGKKVALLWKDQHNRMDINLCDAKNGCTDHARVPLARKETFAGIACHDRRCLMIARDTKGIANLGWFTMPQGKLTWWRPLADATPDTTFSLTAAGDNAFAVGYVTREGATAIRVIESGSMVRAWADPYSSDVPALAWSNDRLLVAHRHDSGVAPEVVPLPR
jgi:hypothetical protein